jgi:hypothetical protein
MNQKKLMIKNRVPNPERNLHKLVEEKRNIMNELESKKKERWTKIHTNTP